MCEKAWSRSWSKSSEPDRSGPEDEDMSFQTCPDGFSSEGKPSDVKVNYFFSQLREELGRIRKTLGSSDNAVSLAFASICNLERHIAAQEKKSQETVMSPEKDHSVAQKISELRGSLGDESPRETENSSSKEEELILVRPVKGVDKEGRLILGDPKLLRASALKS